METTAVFRSNLVPRLYLHGISAGDTREALAALAGKEAPGL